MKLYTEEQVRQMLEVCRDSDLYEHILTFEDILKTQTPIEIPIESIQMMLIKKHLEGENK
jgi:hypothetical protein